MGCFIEGHPNIELSVSESKLLFIQNGNEHEKMKKEIKRELKNSLPKIFTQFFFFKNLFGTFSLTKIFP